MTDFVEPDDNPALDTMTRARLSINFDVNRALASDPVLDDHALQSSCSSSRVPMLFVHGSDDPRSVEGPAQLVEGIPSATMTIVPGAGHLPWVEEPEIVKASLTAFISRFEA